MNARTAQDEKPSTDGRDSKEGDYDCENIQVSSLFSGHL
jgi:hypothetical protein